MFLTIKHRSMFSLNGIQETSRTSAAAAFAFAATALSASRTKRAASLAAAASSLACSTVRSQYIYYFSHTFRMRESV
jgi:hypothetical protein